MTVDRDDLMRALAYMPKHESAKARLEAALRGEK